MSAILERTSYRVQAPLARVIGCGDLGLVFARTLARRHPLHIADIAAERLHRAVRPTAP